MRTKEEIKTRIKHIEQQNIHCLNRKPEDISINAPVALMQLAAGSKLDELYWALGKDKRPMYIYDGGRKKLQ